MNKNKLLNISSHYNLRVLFSYLEFNRTLQLVKYNKLLQEKLRITNRNYITETSYQYIKKEYEEKKYNEDEEIIGFYLLLFFIFIGINLYLIPFTLLLLIICIISIIFCLLIFINFILNDCLYLTINKIIYFLHNKFYKFYCSFKYRKIVVRYFLIEFKNIKIKKYLLPNNFEEMKNKIHYLNSIAKEFLISHSMDELELISSINYFRRHNNTNPLLINNNFPVFIIKGSSNIFLTEFKHYFKINNRTYLFKYEKGKFIKNFMEKNVLLNNNLNRINIITQNDNKYILVYEDFEYYSKNKEENDEIDFERIFSNYKMINETTINSYGYVNNNKKEIIQENKKKK